MTLNEGMKLLRELEDLLPEVGFNKYTASVRLGIRAIHRIKEERALQTCERKLLLPGETE